MFYYLPVLLVFLVSKYTPVPRIFSTCFALCDKTIFQSSQLPNSAVTRRITDTLNITGAFHLVITDGNNNPGGFMGKQNFFPERPTQPHKSGTESTNF